MGNDLAQEQIGLIGERQFELLCAQAGLICNKSFVDVMGWDFIVEFPMGPARQGIALDQRPTSAVRVQLKSTLGRAESRGRLSLSAIDRLAKDPHPSVIIVFRMKPDGVFQSGYLVHLIGKELAQVLRRLRIAEARKDYDINRADISYDYEKAGKRFEIIPEGLREALTSAGRQDPTYTIEKQRQLNELGYQNGRFEAEAVVWIEDQEHLNNVLLGLAPLKPQSLQIFDSRFGIRIPYQGALVDNLDELLITPPGLGPCQVSIKGPGLGSAARFEAEMFIGPPLPGGPEVLIRHRDFNIRFTPAGLKFETGAIIRDVKRTLDEWAELTRALALMATGRGRMTLSGNGRLPPISLDVDQPVTGPYLVELPQISEFLERWQGLLKTAGLRSIDPFDFDTFWSADNARLAVDIMTNSKPLVRIEVQDLGDREVSDPIEGLYFNSCTFADVSLTYSAKVLFERADSETWRYHSASFQPLDVRPKVEDLDQHGIDQAESCGLNLIIHPNNIVMLQAPSYGDA